MESLVQGEEEDAMKQLLEVDHSQAAKTSPAVRSR